MQYQCFCGGLTQISIVHFGFGGKREIESAIKMTGKTSVTLHDVARLAGVSIATVSRCLNKPDAVRADKRKNVETAIRTLGYVPDGTARALVSRRSRMIGAIFPAIDSALFGSALEEFQQQLAAEGYTVVVASSGYDPELELQHVRNLIQNGIDALLLVGMSRSPEVYRLIEMRQIPYVTVWRNSAGSQHPSIGFDNVAAAEHLTDYLVGLGHRRFAVFSGLLAGNDRARDRVEGVRRSLERQGIDLPADAVLERPFGVDEGREMARLVLTGPNPPTAIVCGSEPFAYGSIFEAKDMGIDIPRQLSVSGFDDLWLASQIRPSLTTVRTPHGEIGKEAAKYLLARLNGRQLAPPRALETQLIIRKSTASPPH